MTPEPTGRSVADTRATNSPPPTSPALVGPAVEAAVLAGRYRLEEEIGRGGMGLVYRAFDPACQRTLAVKVLQDRYRDNTDLPGRFLEEARLTAQLQHPGVPPVHDIGTLPDGRPFFAMKLIKGRTLAELLKERPPGADAPGLLAVFEAVCQTVAYVHSRGVIHRDLKPSNVMVGAFGEVQVMDWGLAKVLSLGEEPQATSPDESSTIYSARSSGSGSHTHTGDVLGTPAYMAPEQARGEAVDARADVFGLGAILCAILTGSPPFADVPQVALRRAQQADLSDAFARLDDWGGDAELIGLAKRCLAAEPASRPRDGQAAADALAAYQSGVRERLRRAELDAVEARRQAEVARERARRRLTVAGAVVAVGAVVGGGALWAYGQAAARTAAADQGAGQAMDEAQRLWEQARKEMPADRGTYAAAVAAAAKAAELARAGPGSPATRREAIDLRTEVEVDREASARDRLLLADLLDVVLSKETVSYRRDAVGALMPVVLPTRDEQYASAFRDWGLDVDATPKEKAAARLRVRPAAVAAEVVAALDAWAEERPAGAGRARLTALAAELDTAEAGSRRRHLRELLDGDRLGRERVLREVSAALMPPWGELAGLVPGPDHDRLRQFLQETDPGAEPVLAVLTLARALERVGDGAEAGLLLRRAVLARPAEAALRQSLGDVLGRGHPPAWAEAVECYQAARALRPELGGVLAQALDRAGRAPEGEALLRALRREQPDNPDRSLSLGNALEKQGRFADAEDAYREGLRLRPKYPLAHVNLGNVLAEQGKYEEAEAAYREAVRLRPEFPLAHTGLGFALSARRKYAEAETACRDAIRLDPDYAEAHHNLGITLIEQSKYKEAEAACRDAVRLKPDSADAHVNLGNALTRQGRHEEADAAYREAVRLNPDYAQAHHNLGIALGEQGKYQEAEAAFRRAIRLRPEDVEPHYGLAKTLDEQRRYAEAGAAWREALKLKPDNAQAHYNLGHTLSEQREYEAAAAAFRQAVHLQPDWPEAHCNLGHTLRARGRFEEALASLRRGHELGSKTADWSYPSAQWVRECERLLALDRKLPAVLRGDEAAATAGERLELAVLCQQYRGRPAAAARLYAAAFAADPRLAGDLQRQSRYNAACAAVLASAGRGEDGPLVPDRERGGLRRLALQWLRADLAAYVKHLPTVNDATKKVIRERLGHQQIAADLAAVRDREAVAKLPDDERADWENLWAGVAELLKKTETK